MWPDHGESAEGKQLYAARNASLQTSHCKRKLQIFKHSSNRKEIVQSVDGLISLLYQAPGLPTLVAGDHSGYNIPHTGVHEKNAQM